MSKLDKAMEVIQDNIKSAKCGIFSSRNIYGDKMTSLYEDGEIAIDICYHYEYFEVFGLSNEEFSKLEKFYNELRKHRH